MRIRWTGTSLFVLFGCTFAFHGIAAAGPGNSKLYLLLNPSRNEWCRYDDAASWRKDVDLLVSTDVATITYTSHRPHTIQITSSDEAADWTIYDTYTLNSKSQAVSLLRETLYLPDDTKRTERFQRRDGKLFQMQDVRRPLRPGGVVTAAIAEYPQMTIWNTVSQLPFSSLIREPILSDKSQPFCIHAQVIQPDK